MAGENADVALELSVRVKDMTAQALARIGKTAAEVGKQTADAFKVADAAAKRAAMTGAQATRTGGAAGDAMRRMAEGQRLVNAEAAKTAVVLPTVNAEMGRAATVLPKVSDGFEKSAKSSKMFGTSLGALGGLLKRSPLLILVDLGSRVAGFNGVMDLFNKAMNGAADVIREWIGLAPAHVDAVDEQAKAVSRLREEYDALAKAARANTFEIEGPTFSVGRSFDLTGLEGKFREEAIARLVAFEDAQEFIKTSAQALAAGKRMQDDLDALRQRQEDYAEATKAAEKAQADWNKSLERGAAIVARQEDLERRRRAVDALATSSKAFVVIMRDLAVAEALAATAAAKRREEDERAQAAFAEALERGEAIKKRREYIEGLAQSTQALVIAMRDLAVMEAGQATAATRFLAEETARLTEEQRLFAEQAAIAGQWLDQLNDKRRAEKESTFGFGFGQVLNDLKEINRYLGQQLAGGAFEGLRSLFRDVAIDIKNASQYLKEFGNNFARLLVDIFSQKAAAGLLTGLFGPDFLNFEQGGVMPGQRIASLPVKSYASGGIADSPQVAIYGEGRAGQFGEAFVPLSGNRRIPVEMRGGGGGGPVLNATFQVNSLDPSTAASVILSNMDLIGRGITSMLQSGQDRALRTAVRGA